MLMRGLLFEQVITTPHKIQDSPADGHGKIFDFALAPDQAQELPLVPTMLDSLPIIPLWVVTDKGYASDTLRERIWDMEARPAIPAKRCDAQVACPK